MAVSGQPTVKTLKAALTTVQPITAADRAGDGQPTAERATVSCCWPVQSPGSQGRAVGRYSPLVPRVVLLAGTVPWLTAKCRPVGRYSPLAHSKVAEVGLQLFLFRTGPFRPHLQGHGS